MNLKKDHGYTFKPKTFHHNRYIHDFFHWVLGSNLSYHNYDLGCIPVIMIRRPKHQRTYADYLYELYDYGMSEEKVSLFIDDFCQYIRYRMFDVHAEKFEVKQ